MHKIGRLLPKILIGALLGVSIFQAWRRGDFKGIRTPRKNHSSKPYLFLLLGVPFLMVLLFPFDAFLLHAVQSLAAYPFFASVAKFGSLISDNIMFWIVLLAVHLLLRLAKQETGSQRFFGAILASVVTGFVCHGLKFTFLRARPYTGLSPFSFFNHAGFMSDPRAFQSFPSGDVAIVSGAAGYFFHAFPNRILRWLLFLLPLATAFARVSLNRHWVSDTVGSLWLGLTLSRGVWNYFRANP